MKKNILFIIPGLGAGGGEKSLINLLTQIDFNKYNVDLFLLNHEGLFMDFIPKEVNVLSMKDNLEIFNKDLKESILKYLSKGKINLAYSRLMFCLVNRFNKNKGIAEQYSFKYLRKAIGAIDKKYDVAIGYLEKTSNYICVDCVEANKKIGWIHNDYRKLNLDKRFDEKYFKNLNYLITVSEECEKVLKEEFPKENNKVRLIFNIVSKKVIKNLANEEIEEEIMLDNKINILSIGRLNEQKGFDIAIDAFKILLNRGMNIRWYVIGEGEERKKLEDLIEKKGLKNEFKLLGLRSNPYKYLKNCDIYVQPSRFEGKSIAMDEAKILCKPIVATNFSTVRDQINDRVDGIITEMDGESLAKGIMLLINDTDLKKQIEINLNKLSLGTESEINNLYKLFK